MPQRHLHTLLIITLVGISLCHATAAAAINFDLTNRAKPKISILVGKHGKKNTNEVLFSVPASQLGNGTAITDSRSIIIQVDIRASGANPLTGFLTVDSFSQPLKNTSVTSTSTIPFTEISWTARDGDIPSGRFNGTQNQPVVNFQSSQRYSDYHTFSYANTLAIESGIYEGRVTYTWAVP